MMLNRGLHRGQQSRKLQRRCRQRKISLSNVFVVSGVLALGGGLSCLELNPSYDLATIPGSESSDSASANAGEDGNGSAGESESMQSETEENSSSPDSTSDTWGALHVNSEVHGEVELHWVPIRPYVEYIVAAAANRPLDFIPVDGESYAEGGEIIYVGPATYFDHLDVGPGAEMQYAVWAKHTSGVYTPSLETAIGVARWLECGGHEDPCYDDVQAVLDRRAMTPSGHKIALIDADGVGPGEFLIWKEFRGERVLRADGFDGWSLQRTVDGKEVEADDLIVSSLGQPDGILAGRACPRQVYGGDDDERMTNQCIYYTYSLAAQQMGAAGISQVQLGEIGLGRWSDHTSGRLDPRWYVGNLDPCAQIGMRLPTLFEFSISASSIDSSNMPDEELILFDEDDGIPLHHTSDC